MKVWEWFGDGLGKVLGLFFSLIFRILFENSNSSKTSKKPMFLQCFVGLELLKCCQKSDEKSMKVWSRKITVKKSLQSWLWEGLGLHSGRVWDALGRPLGTLGRLVLAFWSFKDDLFASMGPRWTLRNLLDRFGIDCAMVLEGFWENFGKL